MAGARATGIIDRYLLRLLMQPLGFALGFVLVAMLLERLLRLLNLLAASSSALDAVLLMLANLVPHYLGLALPTGFFASIFMAVARLGDDNEIDALLASGRSILQLARPYLLLALALAVFAFYLFGWLQPYSRYRYHEVRHSALHENWNARAQENVFTDAGRGLTLTAAHVDGSGRQLEGVFLRRHAADHDEILSAVRGRLQPAADGHGLELWLEDGRLVREDANGETDTMRFSSGLLSERFNASAPPFRARGNSERELTLNELIRELDSPAPAATPDELRGELHGRLARTLAIPFLPLLAFPLGMAAKRGHRAPSVIVACLLLLMLHHGVQFGESLAQTGRAPAIIAVWSPVVVFAATSIWLFFASLKSPGDNPVTRLVRAFDSLMQDTAWVRRLLPRRKAR